MCATAMNLLPGAPWRGPRPHVPKAYRQDGPLKSQLPLLPILSRMDLLLCLIFVPNGSITTGQNPGKQSEKVGWFSGHRRDSMLFPMSRKPSMPHLMKVCCVLLTFTLRLIHRLGQGRAIVSDQPPLL